MQAQAIPAIEEDERALIGARATLVPGREAFAMPQTPPKGGLACPIAALRMRRSAVSMHQIDTALRRLPATLRRLAVREYEMGTGFLLAPLAMAGGILTYGNLTSEPGFMPLGLSAAVLVVLAFASARRSALAGALVVVPLLFVAGMAVAKGQTVRANTVMLASPIATEVSGYVRAVEQRADGRVRLTIDVTATARPHLRYQPQRVRVTARGAPPLRAGDHITGRARLMPHYGPVFPGSYDFARDAYFDGIGANGFFLGRPKPSAPSAPRDLSGRLSDPIHNLRLAMAQRISDVAEEGAAGAIAAALVTGVTSAIPDTATQALRDTGLAHILSISGLHMALVAGIFLGGLRAAMAAFPTFSARHPAKKYAAAGALAAALFYQFLAGSGVATQRSFIMLAVMLVAVMADRAAVTMRNLALAALFVMLVSPHEVAGPSFQMSFAATAALVAVYTWIARRRNGRQNPFPTGLTPMRKVLRSGWQGVKAGALTSLIGGSATALFAAYHFHGTAPFGFVANVLAMPVVSLVIMPAGVAGAIAMPFGIDAPFFVLMGWGVDVMMGIAFWVQSWSATGATGIVPVQAFVVATAGFSLCVLLQTPMRAVGLPVMLAGAILATQRDIPEVFISDDAKLVAVHVDDAIAINRKRPNEFTMEIWRKAMGGRPVMGPRPVGAAAAAGQGQGFACDGTSCTLETAAGAVVAYAVPKGGGGKVEAGPEAWCGKAVLVVIADPARKVGYTSRRTAILSARALALRGSAVVYLAKDGSGTATIRHAYDAATARPWQQHRKFSRAARGLAERPEKMARKPLSNGGSSRPASPGP